MNLKELNVHKVKQDFDIIIQKVSPEGLRMVSGEEKNGKPNIAPLQPPTLATFRSWGSSAGAGRADLPVQRYN